MVVCRSASQRLLGLTTNPSTTIMQELLLHERKGIDLYRQLLDLSKDRSVSLEEFARQKIRNEEMHVAEIEKMLRRRGDA
jgi:bacterioferritin